MLKTAFGFKIILNKANLTKIYVVKWLIQVKICNIN